jgi:plastocyanin
MRLNLNKETPVKRFVVPATLFYSLVLSVSPAQAEAPEITVQIKDHRFAPETVKVPAGQKVKLIVENLDATAEEFESYDLHREKVVAGNSKISVWIGPLGKGSYKFFGDFNQATAQGVVSAE